MCFNTKHFLAGVTLLLLTITGWAAQEPSRTDSAQWSTSKDMYIGGTQVCANSPCGNLITADRNYVSGQDQGGPYKFIATEDGSSLFIERDGLTVANVPCYWVKLPQNAAQFKVITDKDDEDRVVRIEFADRPYALVII